MPWRPRPSVLISLVPSSSDSPDSVRIGMTDLRFFNGAVCLFCAQLWLKKPIIWPTCNHRVHEPGRNWKQRTYKNFKTICRNLFGWLKPAPRNFLLRVAANLEKCCYPRNCPCQSRSTFRCCLPRESPDWLCSTSLITFPLSRPTCKAIPIFLIFNVTVSRPAQCERLSMCPRRVFVCLKFSAAYDSGKICTGKNKPCRSIPISRHRLTRR